jgi:hypothetical protein
MTDDIQRYHKAQPAAARAVLDKLRKEIDRGLAGAESKIWHAHPVWFLEGNPIVGYSVLKGGPRLLFWSGQTFREAGLKPEGSFKAAEARFTDPSEINVGDLQRWLTKAQGIQWDYKNIVKRRGVLVRLKATPTGTTTAKAGTAKAGAKVSKPAKASRAKAGSQRKTTKGAVTKTKPARKNQRR